MKKLLILVGCALPTLTFAANQNTNFNHSGIQKGAISESCYHDPCSVAKVTNFKQLQKSPEQSLIELTLLGGSRNWKSKKTLWNKSTHKVFITCSKERPTVAIDGQTTVVPLNPQGVPGVLYSDAELYLKACHNYEGADTKAAVKFGYNIQE